MIENAPVQGVCGFLSTPYKHLNSNPKALMMALAPSASQSTECPSEKAQRHDRGRARPATSARSKASATQACGSWHPRSPVALGHPKTSHNPNPLWLREAWEGLWPAGRRVPPCRSQDVHKTALMVKPHGLSTPRAKH